MYLRVSSVNRETRYIHAFNPVGKQLFNGFMDVFLRPQRVDLCNAHWRQNKLALSQDSTSWMKANRKKKKGGLREREDSGGEGAEDVNQRTGTLGAA